MADRTSSEAIKDSPIRDALVAFRSLFESVCKDRRISHSPSSLSLLDKDDLQYLTIGLVQHPAIRKASSMGIAGNLRTDILRFISAIASDAFDIDRVKPLLSAALVDTPDDALLWDQLSIAATESTPPPRPIASSVQQTPWTQNTGGFVNTSEFRTDVDPVLKSELWPLCPGVPNFHETFFGGIPGLEAASENVFRRCTEGNNPLFGGEGWSGWPMGARESAVLTWFGDLIPKLEAFAGDRNPIPTRRRKLLAQPKTPLLGSMGKHSLDIGFVNNDFVFKPELDKESRYRWSHVLVPGELKSNPIADIPSIAWVDLATYAREVLAAQDSRRFVLGFTLCGSLMRVWEFDRLGGIASEKFDINKDGLRFVTTILGFLWMTEEELGFDPSIIASGGERYIEIERDGQIERLILSKVIRRMRCIAGRATTCWKAYRKEDPQTPLVIKDSWQFVDREEEGELLQEVTMKGVVNIARYYHHETVRIRNTDDDVRSNIRKGLEVTAPTTDSPGRMMLPSSASAPTLLRKGLGSSAGSKRPSSETDAALPPSKRPGLTVPIQASIDTQPNRVHRRVILRDYGKPIYEASSRVTLLAALEACIEGHRSLHSAGFLHRDISLGNLMMNEDEKNPSYPAFLIDLDLAIRQKREVASGARTMTGTRAFMAIGALLNETHTFMHDLESFFWVLFWTCIHYSGPGQDVNKPTEFEKWNYVNAGELATLKKGEVSDERDFLRKAGANFTPHYKSLIPCVNKLRKAVFPNGLRWDTEDERLYSSMKDILRAAQKDENIA